MSIWEEIKSSFRLGSNLTRLIYINLGVFVVFALLRVILFWLAVPTGWVTGIMALPANLHSLLVRPWTAITYMFYMRILFIYFSTCYGYTGLDGYSFSFLHSVS
jgi:hypothetical protein